jgi:hypothetical protein
VFNYNFNDLDEQLLELGEIEVDTIDKIDEEVEFKDKITHLEDKLKGLNSIR